jgi:hypothetical protein
MSWDIFIQDLPVDAGTVADIPDDFAAKSIGTRARFAMLIRRVAPEVSFDDDLSWGHILGDGFRIEIHIGEDPVKCVALFVRGSSAAVGVVAALIECTGLRALDSGTGEFFDVDAARESFAAWKTYRDQVAGS